MSRNLNRKRVKAIDDAKYLVSQLLDALLPQRKVLAELREQWGKPGSKREPFAGRWFELLHSGASCVDGKTWSDLEFPRLFVDLDTTVTPLGSQALHKQLREYVDDPVELAARHAVHVRLRDDSVLRERLQLALIPLRESWHAHVVDALYAEAPEPPAQRSLLTLWGAFSLTVLAAMIVWSLSAWWWLVLLPINAVILYRYSWRSLREIEALNGCLRMLSAAGVLCAINADLPQLQRLRDEESARREVRSALRFMRICKSGPAWLMPFLNVAFLPELIVHVWSMERFYRLRQRLRPTFELVSGIDAALALASALERYPHHCQPEIVATASLEILEGRHPLLPNGVPNSIELDGRSALVTGSNMAGKTTFVKMVAINAILGRTVGFCLAARAILPCLPVMAAIYGEHSVEAGKSRYFAEIEAIRGFLDSEANHEGGVFVLDEPFSGTNTTERVAIACAVLRALGERSMVLVTTHDVELQAMLGERYELYHFQEDPEVKGYFDYRLRVGAATERNAIRLLARMNFPPEVVSAAMDWATRIG